MKESPLKEFKYADPSIKIGEGKYGPVNLIIHQNEIYALKIIPKKCLDNSKRIDHIKNERKILHKLRKYDGKTTPVDFTVELIETFTDELNVCFVFEYLPGQDLYWILKNEHNLNLGKSGTKRRDWVHYYGSEIVVALETLRAMHIIYRDLKPENVMIDKTGHIKLIDFGFAKQLSKHSNFRTSTNCGTLGYNAPEIISGASGYSFAADIWSFGVMIAELLSG
jgi:serine/threonine protein kinase